MRASIGLIALAVVACSTPSDIVKTGPTTYRVRPEAGGGNPSDADIKSRGIARANEFCDAQRKRAVIDVGLSQGWHLWSVQTAEVRFYCDDRTTPSPATRASSP
jgi:hypothetical protein